MAILEYPLVWGYARWHARLAYSSGESPFLDSEFAPASFAIPVRPQGRLLWEGELQSPIYGPRDPLWQAARALFERLDQGVNQIRLPVPADQRRAGRLGATIVGQPMRIDPPVRRSRGETVGWILTWIEVP